jgi:hypothetical protein
MHNPIEQINDRTQARADRLRRLPTEMPPYNWQEFKRRAKQGLPATRERLDWRHMAAAAALLLVVCGIAVWARRWGDERPLISSAGTAKAQMGSAATEPDVASTREQRMPARGAGAGQPRILPGSEQPRIGLDSERPRVDGENAADAAARAGADAAARTGTGMANENSLAAVGATSDAALAALHSRAIDSWLAALPREPVVVHVGTRAAVARLEDRIAQVDDLLTSVRLDGMRPDRLAALQRERVRLVGSLAQVRYAEVVASESP